MALVVVYLVYSLGFVYVESIHLITYTCPHTCTDMTVATGARFSAEDQARYAKITETLAELCTVFTQVGRRVTRYLVISFCCVFILL